MKSYNLAEKNLAKAEGSHQAVYVPTLSGRKPYESEIKREVTKAKAIKKY